MKGVLLGLALVGLASWGSHQFDQGPVDVAAAIRAEAISPMQVGSCLKGTEGFWRVACDSPEARFRALRTTIQHAGSDCPQPQTKALIIEKHRHSGTSTYWCMAKI